MISKPSDIEYLSPTSLSTFMMCPRRWYYRYVERLKSRPSGNMIVGSSCHEALEANFRQKIESGSDIPAEEVLDIYSDSFDDRMSNGEVALEKKVGDYKDSGVSALTAYYENLVSDIMPVQVEKKVYRSIPDSRFSLMGIVDIIETDIIRDHKFSGKMKSQSEADRSPQLSAYVWMLDHLGIEAVSLEVATFTGKTARRISKRTQQDTSVYQKFILTPAALDIEQSLTSGNFRCETDGWHCSSKYCGYWNVCPMGGYK